MAPAKKSSRDTSTPSHPADETEPTHDPFANIGSDQVEEPAEVSETSIPVDFGTPSLHMDDEEDDAFAKLGEDAYDRQGQEIATANRATDGVEPIDRVEQAANDLFDSLGVEHDEARQDRSDAAEHLLAMEPLASARTSKHDSPAGTVEANEEDYGEGDLVEQETPKQVESSLRGPSRSTLSARDIGPPAAMELQASRTKTPEITARPESPIQLPGADDPDDIYATLASGNDEDVPKSSYDGFGEQPPSASPPAHHAAPRIELVETKADSIFDNLGSTEEHVPETAELDTAEEQERKYQLLLEEFAREAGEDTIQGDESGAAAAADLFGADAGSTPFDDLLPSDEHEFLQTASSSTTPPALSIENSLQDIEPYDAYGEEGEVSMLAQSSDRLSDTPLETDRTYPGQNTGSEADLSGINDEAKSQVEIDVPYGWYEGDTFHYYTEEQRELVRMTMLEEHQRHSEQTNNLPAKDQGTDNLSAFTPPVHAGMSENAARRTPVPDQYSDPYAPSSSRVPVSAASYYGDSQHTASTASTDPYAPASSYASPVQPSDPYAPATPATAPYDPYAQVYPAKTSPYGSLSKATPAVKKNDRPAPPQRVASTAYDPPFLRPQKSFVRPASAAAVASASYGVPPMPIAPIAVPTPSPAPPTGPPRRSTTPYAPSPQTWDPIHEPMPVQSSVYAPQPREPEVEPPQIASAQDRPKGPPKGSTSRPSSSIAASRQAQRAPSYNAFDPPLRTQAVSRASARAPRPASPTPAFAPSPPAEPAIHLGSRPPSRAAPSFEAPPPTGPSRRATPSFQPPPRSPSVSQRMSPLPRPASRTTSQYGQPAERDYSDTVEDVSGPVMHLPQLHSGQEEPDEEGGPWNDQEDEEVLRDGHESVTYLGSGARHSYEQGQHRANPTPHPPSAQQQRPQSDSYRPSNDYDQSPPVAAPRSTYSPVETRSANYDAYAPPQHINNPSTNRSQQHDDAPQIDNFASQDKYEPRQDGYAPVRPADGASRPSYEVTAPPQASYDPYAPTHNDSMPPHENHPPSQSSYDPYAPSHLSPMGQPIELTSTLGLSSLGSNMPSATNTYDSPYAPIRPADQYTPGPDTHLRVASPNYGTEYGASPPANNYFGAMSSAPADQTYTPQQVLAQRPVSEDPLGRSTMAARNAPIAVFGFGGVLITAFPGMANSEHESLGHSRTASYGYASSRGQLWVRSVSDLVSESALKSNETTFPGPLLLDPSSAKGTAGDKKKKEAVLAYLQARTEEIEKGLPYLKTSANATRREQEGKLALLRVLVALIIGEGKLSGSTQVEDAVRDALQNPSGPTTNTTFSPTSVGSTNVNSFGSSQYSANQNAVSTAASPGQLGQLSTMLANGDKRDAALFAANNGLWSHALLISSSVDQEFWREIVSRFSVAELNVGGTGSAALKASYTLFAGAGPTAVDDLFAAANISDDPSDDQWRQVIGAVVFNGKTADSAYLDDLGVRLTSAGLVNAGHVCSLLSPSSAFGDLTPGALERPISLVHNGRDEDAVIFAEVAEYARSLIPVPKGQELPFPGLPQLLPYKLHRAWWAAELGDHEIARRYCAAVESASKVGKHGPSLLSRPFLNSLEDLQERLTGEPSTKPANLIGGRKAGKPGVNKLGSWIEGRLTKFIAGEEDTAGPIKASPPTKGKPKESSSAHIGPFSHFSTISPGPSAPVTRAASTVDIANSQFGTGRSSPLPTGHQAAASSSSSAYDDQYTASSGGGYGGYNPYSGSGEDAAAEGDENTPHALEPASADDDVELLNPMAALSLGSSRQSPTHDYAPPAATRHVEEEEDDDDDLGFGNTSLSRARTPKPTDGAADGKDKSAPPAKEAARPAAPEPAASGKGEQKQSGWLRGWFGKKEGEGSGPIRAKLGEESSMVFDPELKRWIVKGAKPEPAATAPPPPPPSRPQSAAPASRASSATPPPSLLSRSTGSPPVPGMPPATRSSTAATPPGFTEMPDGGIRRQKSSLAESVTASEVAPMSASGSGPPRPPSGPPKPPGSSLDDLLSRPPSKRPASAARKGVKNRYVDVFQGEGNK